MNRGGIGPGDFAPFRDEIHDCHCAICRECQYALADVLDFRGERHLDACRALLAALTAGEHQRVEFADWVAASKTAAAERLETARRNGASTGELAIIERGYVTVKMSDFYATGMGLGVGSR